MDDNVHAHPSGRFQVLRTGPMASPGCCIICGYSLKERIYLDPRLDFDEYGSVIFCDQCVTEMATILGLISPTQARALEARVKEAESEIQMLRSAVANLETISDAVAQFSSLKLVLTPADTVSVSDSVDVLDDLPSAEAVSDDTERESAEPELPEPAGSERDDPELTEPDSVSGRDDVRDDASTDLNALLGL